MGSGVENFPQQMESVIRTAKLGISFGTLQVLQNISLEVYEGEVVGVAGQSGAGKSALSSLLGGLSVPTEGSIHINGAPVRSPFPARALGIEFIHQQPEMANDLSIVDNIFLGNEIGWGPGFKWLKVPNQRRMDRQAEQILDRLEVHFEAVHEKVGNLSGEQCQLIAIARAMTRPSRLIIIDDPTLLLSYPYQQKLLSLIQEWQSKGTAIIFSSNNLDHLLAVADRIVVLREGQQIAEFLTDSTDREKTREQIVAAIVGTTDRQQLTSIVWALDSYYRAREQAEKLRYSQNLLHKDADSGDPLNQQLLDHLSEQIYALDSANAALQAAQRRLLVELEQERKHLAREIHDQVIQDLLGVNYQIEDVEADQTAIPAVKAELMEIRENIRLLVDDLRNICGDLRPPTIDSLGLAAALQSYTQDWTERTDIAISLELDPDMRRLPEAIELSIFRIVQEGLSNVRKHSGANEVHISLQHTSPRTLMLSIADNGRGLGADPSKLASSEWTQEGHYGLIGISERAALLGGRSRLQNQADGGLLIQVEIPYPRVA